ncbi:hypothetical protein PG989_007046 [Apiospora arundinis]
MSTSPALVECRAEFGAGLFLFILRWVARWRAVGFRQWTWHDYFSISSCVFYTLLYAMIEYLAVVGAPIGLTQVQREALPPAMAASFREGAKAMFSSFYFMICLVWSLKATLIMFFHSFTRDTKMENYVRLVGYISIFCFVATCIIQTTHCLPLRRNWQILPDPGFECSKGIITNIAVAVGNVLVDSLLLIVPTVMLKDVRIKLWRKVKIIFLLSLGIFVIGMSIARCILSIGDTAQVAQSSIWLEREALVTIFAVNAPALNALFQREVWMSSRSDSSKYVRHSSTDGTNDDPDNGAGPYFDTDRAHTSEGPGNTDGGDTQSKSRPSGGGMEIYKMTDIETVSRESTTKLVSGTPIVPNEWERYSVHAKA